MVPLIEFRDVRVDGDDGAIVAGFSAAIPAGRLTVMVGPSGAGKTTLLRLLNRLDDPDAGAVLFAGRDVRAYDVLDLRRRVQVVGQVPVTFPGTVAANVGGDAAALLGRVGLSPALAVRSASKAGIEELIVGLARSGLTVVMVTHDPRHTDLADHVVTVERLAREDGS